MKIIDSSPLILFIDKIDEKQCLYLLSNDDEDMKIPQSVYNEFKEKNEDVLDEIIGDGVFELINGISIEEEQAIKDRWPNLGSGEINVLAWAKRFQSINNDFVCVLDDSEARKACESMGFSMTGSIGLLKHLKLNQIISQTQIVFIVEKIRKTNFRIKKEILEDLLNA